MPGDAPLIAVGDALTAGRSIPALWKNGSPWPNKAIPGGESYSRLLVLVVLPIGPTH